MPTIKETIDYAYNVYMHTCNREELTRAAESLAALLADKNLEGIISTENRENAQFLHIKLQLKTHAAVYFCEGYENVDFLTLKSFAESAAKKCGELGFKKTGDLCAGVLGYADAIDRIMFDAVALKGRICDDEGRCVAKDEEECRQVSEALTAKISAASALEFPFNIFADGAEFPDVKGQVVRDLSDLRAVCDRMIAKFTEAKAQDAMRTGVEDITEELNAKHFEYYPTLDTEKLAKALVLCTPYREEAEIVAWACACGAKIYRMQALAFENMPADAVNAVFDHLTSLGADCVIYGMPRFRAKNKTDFIRSVMRFGRAGRRAYLVADDGTRGVYDDALAAATGTYSPLDISFFYLSMPDFKQTVEIMQSLKMLEGSGEEIEYVKKNMPFMGFAGFNDAVKAFAANADWKKIASERSQDNFAAANKYMLKLTRQALFIDVGWGNYHEDIIVRKAKTFDYDDIKVVNADNIRRIMEGNFSLFQKCGMISTYCLLSGASVADWKDYPKEIKVERLTEATKLVMRALGVYTIPRVEILEKLGGDALGMCCDGGKLVQYKESHANDFAGITNTICHECYHAFQHNAINEGWQDWYGMELFITPSRLPEWQYNFSNYQVSTAKGYPTYAVQIVESDARAFANDCLGNDKEGQILNLIDFD